MHFLSHCKFGPVAPASGDVSHDGGRIRNRKTLLRRSEVMQYARDAFITQFIQRSILTAFVAYVII